MCASGRSPSSRSAWGEISLGLDLHRPAIDEVTFQHDGREFRRVPEVFDAWFDSGSMPYAQFHYPFENETLFKESFPADFIAEAVDQTRGWFYSLHAIATMLFDSPAYKNVICLGHVVDAAGEKMSKSRGNVIDPCCHLRRGRALTRCAGTSSRAARRAKQSACRWISSTKVPTNSSTRFGTAPNSSRCMQTRTGSACPTTCRSRSGPDLDRWAIASLERLTGEVTQLLERYDAQAARPRHRTLR